MGRYDNQKQTVLLDFEENNRGELKRLTLKENPSKNGPTRKAFDIRTMYTDDNGELQFTKKGISISDESWVDVIGAMLKNVELEDIDGIQDALNERKAELNYSSDIDPENEL